MALTKKQEAFALAVITHDNASAAYRAAYDAKKMNAAAVNVEACRLMANPKVALRVAELRAPALKAAALEAEETLGYLAKVNRFDIRKLYDEQGEMKPVHQWDDETAAAVSHIGRNGPVPFDKLRSVDMSLKHLGLYERDNNQRGDSLALQVVLVGAK